jgi:hypothetical protein
MRLGHLSDLEVRFVAGGGGLSLGGHLGFIVAITYVYVKVNVV